MFCFDVEVHLNATYRTDSRIPEPLLRIGQERVQPGDTFTYLCTLQLEAASARDALEMAYLAGNARDSDVPGSREYDRYASRSMIVGDVVLVHTPDGPLIAYVDSVGWVDIEDIDPYSLTPGEPSGQHYGQHNRQETAR